MGEYKRPRERLDPPENPDALTRIPRRNRRRHMLGYGGLGPYSRAIARGAVGALLDGRSRAGRFLRRYEQLLVEHVGGNPSIVQRALISRAARLALHLELMDEQALADGTILGVHDHQHYVAWSNALARVLARLGMQPASTEAQPPSLHDYLSGRGRAA